MADEKYDAEGFLVVSVTKDQSEVAERFYATSDVCKRQSLLYLYEGKAHKAHGYASFDEYCLDRLKDDQTPAYRRQQIMWARVERDVLLTSQTENLLPMGNKSAPAQWIEHIAKGALRKHPAEELAKLPQAERREAYQEALAIAAQDHSELSRVKFIVKRRLEAAKGNFPQPSDVPFGASKKKTEESGSGIADTTPQIAPESEPEVEKAPTPVTTPPAPDTGSDDVAEALWARRMAALQSAMSMVRARRISGSLSAQARKDLSAEIFKISMWITDGK